MPYQIFKFTLFFMESYVYILDGCNGGYDGYKIGITMTVKSRMDTYRTSLPRGELRLFYPCADARKIEDIIKRRFATKRVINIMGNPSEWIRVPIEELIAAVMEEAVKIKKKSIVSIADETVDDDSQVFSRHVEATRKYNKKNGNEYSGELHKAAADGSLNIVKIILDGDLSIMRAIIVRDEHNAIMSAVKNGNVGVWKFMLTHPLITTTRDDILTDLTRMKPEYILREFIELVYSDLELTATFEMMLTDHTTTEVLRIKRIKIILESTPSTWNVVLPLSTIMRSIMSFELSTCASTNLEAFFSVKRLMLPHYTAVGLALFKRWVINHPYFLGLLFKYFPDVDPTLDGNAAIYYAVAHHDYNAAILTLLSNQHIIFLTDRIHLLSKALPQYYMLINTAFSDFEVVIPPIAGRNYPLQQSYWSVYS